MAARHSLQVATQAGLRMVELETDNVKLYTHLKKRFCENSSFGRIVADILEIANTCISCSFSHVCRGEIR